MARTKGSAEPSTLAAPGRPEYASYLLRWARSGCESKLMTWPEYSDRYRQVRDGSTLMITITNGAERMACKHDVEVLKHDPRRIVCVKCGKTTAVAK